MITQKNQFGSFLALENDRSPGYVFEANFLPSLLKSGDVAVDCNANAGIVTVAMAKAVGEEGGVLAFESQSFIYYMLCGNLAINHIINSQAFNRAIGDTGGRSFYVPNFTYKEDVDFSGIGYAARIGAEDAQGHTYCKPVAALTVDELNLKDLHLARVDLAGSELQALMGARATIRRCRPILYIRMTKNFEEILEFLKVENYGWSVVDVNEKGRRLAILAYPSSADTTEWFEGPEFVNIDSSEDPAHQPLKEAKAAVY